MATKIQELTKQSELEQKKENIKQAALLELENKMRRDTIEKVARLDNGSDVLKLVGVVGLVVIIGRFANKLSALVEELYMERVEPKYFEKMLKANPKLMQEDVKEVAELWGTMYRTAPHLAQDPIAAGGFITQNINARVRPDMGGPTIDTYDTLSKINKSISGDAGTGDFLGLSGELFG